MSLRAVPCPSGCEEGQAAAGLLWVPVGRSKQTAPAFHSKVSNANFKFEAWGQLAEQTQRAFVQLGDGQRAHPKPPRRGCCRASRIAAPPGWQQGEKKPSVSALNLQQLHVCKGGGVQSLPGSPRPRSRAVNQFQGWERNSWKAETSCWDLGALLGAFARDSHHRAAPASFPSLNKPRNQNVHVTRKKPHLITLCLQKELLALLQLTALLQLLHVTSTD